MTTHGFHKRRHRIWLHQYGSEIPDELFKLAYYAWLTLLTIDQPAFIGVSAELFIRTKTNLNDLFTIADKPPARTHNAPIRFVIFSSYGNDSCALIQWAINGEL